MFVREKKTRRFYLRDTKSAWAKKNKEICFWPWDIHENLLLYLVDLKLGINLRDILINLIIVNWFIVYPIVFLLKEKVFST